jgi:hypothetical protein
MRMASAVIVLPLLAGCTTTPPVPSGRVELGYSACEPMTELRNNLTATPYPSAKSDSILHSLGVRCIGEVYPAAARARY